MRSATLVLVALPLAACASMQCSTNSLVETGDQYQQCLAQDGNFTEAGDPVAQVDDAPRPRKAKTKKKQERHYTIEEYCSMRAKGDQSAYYPCVSFYYQQQQAQQQAQLQQQQMQMMQDQYEADQWAHAIRNVGRAFEQPLYQPQPELHCVTQAIGSQVYTDCR